MKHGRKSIKHYDVSDDAVLPWKEAKTISENDSGAPLGRQAVIVSLIIAIAFALLMACHPDLLPQASA